MPSCCSAVLRARWPASAGPSNVVYECVGAPCNNAAVVLGMAGKELTAPREPQIVTALTLDEHEEYLTYHQSLDSHIKGPLVFR